MATNSKSFSDYYNEALSAQGSMPSAAPLPKAPTFTPWKGNSGSGHVGAPEAPQDFISWITDIASRPLFAVTNPVNTAMDALNKKNIPRVKPGDTMGALGAGLGALGNVATAGIRGFFSTDQADKHYTNQLIEKGTDTAGSWDPKYKDVPDNVNPLLKGTLGFVGDMALDPTTYIPGAMIASAGKKIGQFAKLGTKGGRDILSAEQAAQDAVKATVDTGMSTAEATKQIDSTNLLNSIPDTHANLDQGMKNATDQMRLPDPLPLESQARVATAQAGNTKFSDLTLPEMAAHTPTGTWEVVIRHGGAQKGATEVHRFASQDHAAAFGEKLAAEQKLKKFKPGPRARVAGTYTISDVGPLTSKAQHVALVPPSVQLNAKAAPIQSLLSDLAKAGKEIPPAAATGGPDLSKLPPFEDWLKGMAKYSPKAPMAVGDQGALLHAGELNKVLGDTALPATMRQNIVDQLQEGYNLWKEKTLPQLPQLPAGAVSTTPVGTRNAFNALIATADGQARAEKVLGSTLVTRLRQKESQATFDKVLSDIGGILQRSDQLDKIVQYAKTDTLLKSLMGHLGIDVPGTNIAIMNAESHVPGAAEAVARAEAGMPTPVDPASTVTQDTLAKVGDTRGERMAALDASQKRVVRALPQVIRDEFLNVATRYKFRTKGGVLRTNDVFAEGLGRQEGVWNQYTLWNVKQALENPHIDAVGQVIKDGKFKTAPHQDFATSRALAVKEGVMPDLIMAEELVQREGVQMWIGTKADAVPMSLSQMYLSLEDGAVGNAEKLLKYLYNVPTLVSPTNLYDAVIIAHRGGTIDEIRAALANTLKKNISPSWLDKTGNIKPEFRAQAQITNSLVSPANKIFGFYRKLPSVPEAKQLAALSAKLPVGAKLVAKKKGGATVGWYRAYDSNFLLDELAGIVHSSGATLRTVAAKNAEALSAKIGTEAYQLTKDTLDRLSALVDDPTKMGEALRAIATKDEHIAKVSTEAGATYDATKMAQVNTDKGLDSGVVDSSRTMVSATDAGKAAGRPNAARGLRPGEADVRVADARRPALTSGATQAGKDLAEAERNTLLQVQKLQGEARDLVAERALEARDTLVDISASTYSESTMLIGRIMQPLGRFFVADYGMKLVNPFRWAFGNLSNVRRATMMNDLNKLSKAHPGFVQGTETTILAKAWQDFRHGIEGGDQAVLAAQRDLQKMWDTMFSTSSPDSILGNPFFRTGVSLHKLNETLAAVGVEHQIDVGSALLHSTQNNTDMLTEAFSQWKSWDVKDPLDFINRMYVAAEKVSTDAAVVQSFQNWALRHGLASKTRTAGFAKMTASRDSRYFDMVDQNLYFDPEIINQFGIMDRVSQMSATFDGELGKFIHGPFDLIQGAWKFAITLPRPGHHIRNLIGDTSMTYVAEGMRYSARSARDAFKVLSVKKGYTGIDWNRAMSAAGDHVIPGPGDTIAAGKFGNMSVDEITQAMGAEGLLNSYHALEDLADVNSPMLHEIHNSTLGKVVRKVTFRGGHIEKGAAAISEARDHWVRSQHFIQYLHKAQKTGVDHLGRKIKSREDLFMLAGAQVRKHHPDGSMLSINERKIMRRVMPFYSWVRGAIPAIIESALLHPGRALTFPKASYNLAVSMGIDPYSMSDPFPTDQLFPSFLSEQAFGPQFQLPGGQYLGINPGFAETDVANMFAAPDPIRGIAGAISPFIRTPAELLSGGSWGTGAKINSPADYIDASLPGINYLANVGGYSVTGSVMSALQGKGLTQQYQVAAGNKGGLDQGLSALNWLSGLNIQNMSRENYINYAEIEKRNRATAAGGS